MTAQKRCVMVSLLGEPNVGKSTLVNQITGTKVSIVTHKAQTTRTRVRGIKIIKNVQVVLIDTPGVFVPKRRLDKAMVSSAWNGFKEANIIFFMLDSTRGFTERSQAILDSIVQMRQRHNHIVLLLNKIDKINRKDLLVLSKRANSHFNFYMTFMISADKGSGIKDVINWLLLNAPNSPWLYPEDQVADISLKSLAAEVTREKLLIRLHQEIPHQLTVEPDRWIEMPDKSIKVYQIIYVINKRHKGMVLGKNGEIIRTISIASRKELKEILSQEIHLFLEVKVRGNWLNEPFRFSQLGLSYKN